MALTVDPVAGTVTANSQPAQPVEPPVEEVLRAEANDQALAALRNPESVVSNDPALQEPAPPPQENVQGAQVGSVVDEVV